MSQLVDALFTNTQQNVLGLLYSQPQKSFYLKEILRSTGMGVATIKRELDRMRSAGILTMTRVGNQHHYQANPACPVYEELLGIVKKTFGISDVINAALAPLTSHLDCVFIFGSVASGTETAGSDIDLMVIGDAGFSEVVAALYPAQGVLGREINPKLFSKQEWSLLLKTKGAFVKEVLSKPRIGVIGDKDEPGKPGRENAGKN